MHEYKHVMMMMMMMMMMRRRRRMTMIMMMIRRGYRGTAGAILLPGLHQKVVCTGDSMHTEADSFWGRREPQSF